ncbi:hypothetical protein [Helicobacter sp. 11S02629-2]|uniref:hypothetical protein n=1 Tax=Helicobacter sp. 11S02629-2 TaxID=1476195 RepID=UPI0015DA22B5|nr:hypothetical protein [Helicobacter sp. 11S02629-2]
MSLSLSFLFHDVLELFIFPPLYDALEARGWVKKEMISISCARSMKAQRGVAST